eukprot:CAMPEP_0194050336 /NCGR_PEP_ID=MMETSP0009_2-20130614/34696_1 /TAXON_ID=210454 /ORGANISM="Grammatophora oceanica, Strain CCMP 410" /LENGTH=30 /DNA_ID= /DNA_START= /DNA_END= /DNA_ORIENTATION=
MKRNRGDQDDDTTTAGPQVLIPELRFQLPR